MNLIECMDSYSVNDLRNCEISQDKHYTVYVYFDGDGVPLYVGMSNDVCNRFRFHIGQEWNCDKSQLGVTLTSNMPNSEKWKVELYVSNTPEILEIDLIHRLNPALNIAHNKEPMFSRYVHTTVGSSSLYLLI